MDSFSIYSGNTGDPRKRVNPENDSIKPSELPKRIKHEPVDMDRLMSEVEEPQEQEQEREEQMTITEQDDDDIDYGDNDDDNTSERNNFYMTLLNPGVSLENFGIPISIDKLISSIICLDPTFHCIKNLDEVLDVKSKLRDITNKLTFENVEIYCLYYLPIVVYKFCKLMAKVFNQKKEVFKEDPAQFYEDIFILNKEEFHSELDLKVIKIRRKHEFDGPKAGDFVILRIKSKQSPDDVNGTFEEMCHFGIFLSSQTRILKPDTYATERLVINTYPEGERADLICEESVVRVRHVNTLFLRTDFQPAIFKLANCLPLMLQAKALYSLGANPCLDHFLNPSMTIKTSGLVIEEDLNLPMKSLDTIQKAIDLVGQINSDSSRFLTIDFDDPSCYYSLLEPILKQIILKVDYMKKKDQLTPILVLSKDEDLLKVFYEKLTRDDFFGENGVVLDPSPKTSDVVDSQVITLFRSHIDTLKNTNIQKGIQRYTKCIDYLQKNHSLDDLTSQWIVDMAKSRREIRRKVLRNSKIILTDMETLCKDDQYLINFSAKNAGQHRILCCIIIDAHLYTEPETITLTNFGVDKFILFGSSSVELAQEEELTSKQLNRSLFQRLKLIEAKNEDKSPHSSFVQF